jgi:nitroreductase
MAFCDVCHRSTYAEPWYSSPMSKRAAAGGRSDGDHIASDCLDVAWEHAARHGERNMRNMLEIIQGRRSTREAFDPSRPIAKAPTPNNMQNFEVLIVDEPERLKAIGAIPAEMSEALLRENYDQLSFSEGELVIKKTGLLASTFPPAWTNPEAWSPDSDYTSQLSFLEKFTQPAPLLVVVLYDSSKRAPGSDGDFVGHLSLGCVMEQLRRILGIPEHMKIAFACRLGYPAAPSPDLPHVRRDIEDFVHHNQFGRKEIVWSSAHDGSKS